MVGKGEPILKRKRMSKKRTKKLHLSESDKLLEGLYEISKAGTANSEKARSFINWWLSNQSWTENQWAYIRHLIADHWKPKVKLEVDRKYHLYAISDGTALKIGFSCDIPKRCKSMQTGHPTKLKVVWKYYVGKDRKEAMKLEGALHRFCKKERIRGEWFTLSASIKLEKFQVKRTDKDDAEIDLVISAQQFI